ncbi:MAG: PAS domain S-box protein [Ghiorsea sp.]|nr:PAS domain S-box protein [Ghiorsea sp.]
MKRFWLYGLVGVVTALLLMFFYQKSVGIQPERVYQVESIAYDLAATHNKLTADMGLLVQGRLSHYDTITQAQMRLLSLQHKLQASVAEAGEALRPELAQLAASVQAQIEPVETFKTSLALYRNSLRYLPTLMADIEEKSPESAGVLHEIQRRMYVMLSQPSEFDQQIFLRYLAQLKSPEFQPLKQHLQAVFEHYTEVSQAMALFIALASDQTAKTLSQAYLQWSQQQDERANLYRLLLLLLSGLLLLYIVWVLWRLQQSRGVLKKTNTFLHYLQKALDEHAIVSITDKAGNIIFANDKFSRMSGYTLHEMLGKNHRILKSGIHSEAFYNKLWATISGGKTWRGVMQNKAKDGSFYWVDSSITPIFNEQGDIEQYISVRTDITQQVDTLARFKESRARYKVLSDMIPYALGVVQRGAWVYVNKSAVALFATGSMQEMLNQPVTHFFIEDEKNLVSQVQQACEQQSVLLMQEGCLQTMQGQKFAAELQGAPLLWEGEPALLLAIHDITERKAEAEAKQTYQEQLEHTQRLESLGVLAGGIAHDFNNILAAIMGNAALAVRHVEEPQALLQYLDKIKISSMRAAELCEQMLMYAGGGVMDKQPVLLHELLHDVANMVRATLTNQITLEADIAADVLPVEADIRQVQQVMLNLLTNAAESIEGRGVIRLKLGMTMIDADAAQDWVGEQKLACGQYVFLEVSDTGCGMDRQTKAKIFEPFFYNQIYRSWFGYECIVRYYSCP